MLASAHRAFDSVIGATASLPNARHDTQLCLSLLPLFNFSEPSKVNYDDWVRGTRALRLHEMAGDPELWEQLVMLYGDASRRSIDLAKVTFLVPMEPHISLLFRAMVDGLSRVTDVATGQQNKEAARRDVMASRAIMKARRAILEPPLEAWRQYVKSEAAIRKRMKKFGKRLFNREARRAFNQWLGLRFGSGGDRQVDYGKLRGYINRLRSRGLVRAFGTWSAQAERRSALRAIINRMKRVPVVKAVNRWRTMTKAALEQQEFLRGCLNTFSPDGREKRKVLNSWIQLAFERRLVLHAIKTLTNRDLRSAFNAWIGNAMDFAEQLYCVQQAVASMRLRGVRSALNSWISFVAEAMKRQRRLRSVAGTMFGDNLRKAWNTWSALSELQRRMTSALNRFHMQGQNRALQCWIRNTSGSANRATRVISSLQAEGREKRKALNSWISNAEQIRRMRNAVAAIVRRSEYEAFNAWAEAVMGRARRFEAMARSIASMNNRGLKSGLNRWIEFAYEASEAQRRLRSAGKAFSGDVTSKAWYSWLEAAELQRDLSRQRASMVIALKRFVMQNQSRAFETWQCLAAAAAAAQKKMRSCVTSLSPEGRAMRKAFNSWCDVAASTRSLHRAASSLMHRCMRAGLNSWTEFADEEAAKRLAMRKAIGALAHRGLRAALNGWATYAEEASEHRRKLAAATSAFVGDGMRKAWNSWVDSMAQLLAMKRAISSLKERSLRLGFNAWSHNAFQASNRLFAMRKAIASMTHNGLRGALNTWIQYVDAATEGMRLLRSALASMSQREVRKAYNSWETLWLGHVALRKAVVRFVKRKERVVFDVWLVFAARLRADSKHQEHTMRKAAASLCNRGLQSGLNRWIEFAYEASEAQRRLRSAGKAFSGDVTSKAWYSWLEAAELQRDLSRQRASMVIALKRFVMQNQSRAFETWQCLAAAAAAAQKKMRSCVTSLSPEGRAMRKAFNSWCDVAASTRSLHRAASSLMHRCMRAGLNSWTEFADEEAAKRLAMRKAIGALAHRGLRAALNGWATYAEEASEHRRKLAAATSAFVGDGMRKAWNKWSTITDEEAHRKRLAMQAVSRLAHAPLARAWSSWRGLMRDRLHALDLASRTVSFFANGTGRAWNQWVSLMPSWYRLRRFARRLLRRDLLRAWGQWEVVMEERKRLQRFGKRALNADLTHAWAMWIGSMLDSHRMRRFASRLASRDLGRGFDTWADLVAAENRSRARLKPFVRRMLQRGVNNSLNKWQDVAHEGRRMRTIAKRMLHSGLSRCLNKWSVMAYERARSMRLLRRVSSRVSNRLQVRTFEAWATLAMNNKEERDARQLKALNLLRNKEVAAVFYAWQSATQAAAELRFRYAAKWYNALAAKTFTAWARWAGSEVNRRARMKSIAIRMARRIEVIVLQEWRRYVSYAREQAGIAVARWMRSGMWRCFQQLQVHAERQSHLKRLASRLCSGMLISLQMRAFNAWMRQVAHQRQRREHTVHRSLQRMRFGTLSIVFQQWQEMVEESRRLKLMATEEEETAARLAAETEASNLAAAAAAAAAAALTDDGGGLSAAESAALKADVASLRRELALTRRELHAVSIASAKRYELAIVRAELLTRPAASGSDGGEMPEMDAFPSVHASLWKYAAPFVPDDLQDKFASNKMPEKLEAPTAPPVSAFQRRLTSEAPLTFLKPEDSPKGVSTIASVPSKPQPPRPSSGHRRADPSPRVQRIKPAPTLFPTHSSGLPRVKSKEEIVGQAVRSNLQHHAERVGLAASGACQPA